jgi:hypothetical protein
MIDTQAEIANRLSVLVGLDVSGVSRAADMLTMHFGPLKQYTTRRGTVLEGGAWALHVQCCWHIDRSDAILANQDDLRGSDEAAMSTTERLTELLVVPNPAVVESVVADATGSLKIALSGKLRLVVTPDGIPEDEDWRFFAPGTDARHFVIEGGKIEPHSLG